VSLVRLSPQLDTLVNDGSPIESLASGFTFLDGAVWLDGAKRLLFSDLPASVIYSWDPVNRASAYRRPSNRANGLGLDEKGRLLTCEHDTSRIVREEPDGSFAVVVSHYGGLELNSPNDVILRSDGSLYFTDPPFGRQEYWGTARPKQLSFQGVFRIPRGSTEPILLADQFQGPNGICFSPDESVLYVSDTPGRVIWAFQVHSDGTLDGGTRIFEMTDDRWGEGGPDGMKADEKGNFYCAGPRGVWVFSSVAEHLGIIEVPEPCANLAWGGDSHTDLFVTATTSLYRIGMLVHGAGAQRILRSVE